MQHELSNELQLMLRLTICDRDTALSMVEEMLDANEALSLQSDLPERAAFPRDREVDVEVVAVGPGLGLRMAQMPALLVAEDLEGEATEVRDTQARQRAVWLVTALEKREAAIRRVAEVILAADADYFLGKRPTPAGIDRDELAKRAGMQPTSIDRVVANKVIHSPRGRASLAAFVGS